MTFRKYLITQLIESAARTTAISAYALQSRNAGNRAEQEYNHGLQALNRRRSTTTDSRLAALEISLASLLRGHIQQRKQIGAGVAVSVASALMKKSD